MARMADKKTAFESQEDKFNMLFNELGRRPSLSYVLYKGAENSADSNEIDHKNPAHISNFLKESVSAATDDFLDHLNKQEPLVSSSITNTMPKTTDPISGTWDDVSRKGEFPWISTTP